MNHKSLFKPKAKGKYRIENRTEAESTVYLYDEIGWFGVLAEDFIKDLNNIASPTINLRVNSPGGSVFDGTAIFNAIKQHKSKVVAYVDGLAASISSVIVMAADEVVMAKNAYLMIHEPWSIAIGTAEDFRKEADLLDKVGGTIAETYMDKSGKKEEEILDLMGAETWFTAKEALENGFIDRIYEDEQPENAKVTLFDLSVFANVPDNLMEKKTPDKRDIEKILKESGLSGKQAKALLSNGYTAAFRDEQVAGQETLKDRDDVEEQRDAETPVVYDRVQELLKKAEQIAPAA